MIAEKDIKSQVDEIAYEFQNENLEADSVLREIVQAGRKPNYAEAVYFLQRLGWDENAVNRQIRRMGNVMRFQAIAGSAQDRSAALKERDTAAKVLETEGPKVAEQIAKLQAKLAGFERDASLSAKRVDEQNEAVGSLRNVVPQTIVDHVNAQRKMLGSTMHREILNIRTRINELECVLNRSRYPASREGEALYLEAVRRCVWEAVQDVGIQGIRKLALSPQWPSIRTELEAELKELEEKIGPLQAEYDEALAKAEQALDYYIVEQAG